MSVSETEDDYDKSGMNLERFKMEAQHQLLSTSGGLALIIRLTFGVTMQGMLELAG